VELKLASGMTNPGRLKDLADVQELIRLLGLPADFAAQLQPFVAEKYGDLWRGCKSERSRQQPVVLGVRTDPEPHNAIRLVDSQRAVVLSNTH
jgi:hypothetical protein